MYTCNICNYETNVRTAIYVHNKTKKHINNIIFKKEKEEQQIKLIEKENEKLKQELINKDKEIIKLETKVEIYKELSEKGKTINNGIIINNLTYVNKHFKNAPPLKKISNFVLNGIDLEDDTQIDKLMENIIYSYNNKCLHKLIGDHIVENYKKDDLKLQSFHAIDIARRKYLVKLENNQNCKRDNSFDEIDKYNPDNEDNEDNKDNEDNEDNEDNKNNNNDNKNNKSSDFNSVTKETVQELKQKIVIKKIKSKWTTDNEGVKLSYLLFDPVIKQIIRQLKKNCRKYNSEMKKNKNKIPTMDEIKKFEVLANMMKEIDTDKLKTNINNYIAPYFSIVKK